MSAPAVPLQLPGFPALPFVDPNSGRLTPAGAAFMTTFLQSISASGGVADTAGAAHAAATAAQNAANTAQAAATAAQSSANAAQAAATTAQNDVATETTRAEAAEALLLPKLGVTNGSDAPAGQIGEYISASVVVGSAVALTTGVAANVVSISLTAGDWDVRGVVAFNPAATTSVTGWSGGASTTSAALPPTTSGALVSYVSAAFVPNSVINSALATSRLSLSSTTTVYLVASANFTVSTMGAFGVVSARRVR